MYKVTDMGKSPVGGQAVLEGVMMRSPRSFAVAVRRSNGSIVVREEPWRSAADRFPFLKWPLLRGMVVLCESLFNGMSALAFSADQAAADLDKAPDGEQSSKDGENATSGKGLSTGVLLMTMAFSLALAVVLFKFIPHLATVGLGMALGVDIPITSFSFHLIDGVIKLSLFLLYIWGVGRMADMKRVFCYHGAEHKSIACFEADLPLTVANARLQCRFHPRCGTSFIVVVLSVAILLFAAVFSLLPPLADNRILNVVLQMCIKVPLMLPVAGLAYEAIKFSNRPKAARWLRFLTAPGLWTQRLTTAEPDDDMLEVALVSLRTTLGREKAIAEGREHELPSLRSQVVLTTLDEVPHP